MRLGYSFLNRLSLVELAQPILENLCSEVQASTHLAVQEDVDLVFLGMARLQTLTAVNINVGSRLPLYGSSMGRLLLAYKSEEELNRIIGTDRFPR